MLQMQARGALGFALCVSEAEAPLLKREREQNPSDSFNSMQMYSNKDEMPSPYITYTPQ